VQQRAPGVALTLSCEILPEMREFERTSTTVTNADVMPVMARYLESLERELMRLGLAAPLLVMQSNGGVMTAEAGRRRPVHVIESGPAAGVIATAALARRIGLGNAISIDMGGTTAKASVIEGSDIKRTGEFDRRERVAGEPALQGRRLCAARARHRHRRGGRGRRQHRERVLSNTLFTEQAAFLDGYNDRVGREEGTRAGLDNLDAELKGEPGRV
jgi:hypothetical protein